jgi:hypothetical protein
MQFAVFGPLGDRIYESPLRLLSVTAESFTAKMPTSTDFGNFAAGQTVIGFNPPPTGQEYSVVVRMAVEYKDLVLSNVC